MVKQLDYLRNRLNTSIWFIPVCISIASFALGLLMLRLEASLRLRLGLCQHQTPPALGAGRGTPKSPG